MDDHGLYAGDAGAMKAAGHELKGLKSYLQLGLPTLRTPLMVLLDTKGTRLIACSKVPIGGETLAYGSGDAGSTVQCRPEVQGLMAEAGKLLNLKEHIVGRTEDVQKSLFGPVDIEVHLGKDERTYGKLRMWDPCFAPSHNFWFLLLSLCSATFASFISFLPFWLGASFVMASVAWPSKRCGI